MKKSLRVVKGLKRPPVRENLAILTGEELVFDTGDWGKQIGVIVRLIENNDRLPVFSICSLPGRNILAMEKRVTALGLTARERQIVCLIFQGMNNTETGEKLFISRYTVENHIKSIHQKLSVQNRTAPVHKIISFSKTNTPPSLIRDPQAANLYFFATPFTLARY